MSKIEEIARDAKRAEQAMLMALRILDKRPEYLIAASHLDLALNVFREVSRRTQSL